MLAAWLQSRWYQTRPAPWFLRPLAALFIRIAASRRAKQSAQAWKAPVPVVVIGNIAVGGTGKTPLVVTLLAELKSAGLSPAVISRGYGSNQRGPLVLSGHSPAEVGDEPVLISQRSGCPVAIGSERVEVIQALLAAHPSIDVILSDDGLQHYRMARDVECVVIDGARGLGNMACLPAGPLRELPKRLEEVDHLVVNGELQYRLPEHLNLEHVSITQMTLDASDVVNMVSGKRLSLSDFSGEAVDAVAGIGNPERFFETLAAKQITPITHPFADHHPYTAADFSFGDDLPVFMTEKDAVKCMPFAQPHWWYVPVDAVLDGPLIQDLIEALK
jgi:tetraacyldisaccharide 4'-kinase